MSAPTAATPAAMADPMQRSPRLAAQFRRQFVRNRGGMIGLVIILAIALIAIFAPLVAPYDPYELNRIDRLQGPSSTHLMGTDDLGRDLFSRIVYGARISMTVSIMTVLIATLLGAPAGIIAGYFGGGVDSAIMRVMDVIFAFPATLLALAITAFLGPSLRNMIIALGIVYAPGFARIVRGPVLGAKNLEYVEASRVIGASDARILIRHLLPNIISPLIVTATVTFSFALLAEAALSFLGMGAQPPEASWGVMLSNGRRFMETVPSLAIFPGVAIVITVLSSNLLGDALRDVLDPKLRR
jgi:ABC-type dipeptide/oligopeptide/nickel transport system permease subunit